ncbi:MAG: ABC-type multidrug transport system, ATPase component [Synergistales bacterium 54_24]|jgi:ABC-2 type transport system ATP-binding protein|nr:MAG: ABC-type multidrug transport system, ATPase component [Synergistales bacterium 54_24]HAF50507.1 ABC transporter ATP-binding protein [Synergistaceae bacterium]
MEWVVEASELTKLYDGFKAVDSVSFRIAKGEIFGLLGPNGAGKTTTILMLLGLTEPTSGTARVYGYNSTTEPLQVKRVTGYLPENVGFYEELTAAENLFYIARLNGIKGEEAERKIEEALEVVGLSHVKDQATGTFSKGMRQRLGLASVLIKDPKLVILDEPTTGIDPEGTEQVLRLIMKMAHEMGVTVMVSSHLLYQMQRICDRVGIMFKGKMVAQGGIDEIGAQVLGEKQGVMKLTCENLEPSSIERLKNKDGVLDVSTSGMMVVVKFDESRKADLVRDAVSEGFIPIEVRGKEYSLEEIYMRYFQEG